MDGRTGEWTDGQINGWIGRWADGWMGGRARGRTASWLAGWMGGHAGGRTDGFHKIFVRLSPLSLVNV